MDLHNLPKDILIEIIKKTFDFSKLSMEESERLYVPLHEKFKQKCIDEESKNTELMKKKYIVEDLNIRIAYNRIIVGDLFQIRPYATIFNLFYHTTERYNTEEGLINRISEILKISKDNKQIQNIVLAIKILIKSFRDNLEIQNKLKNEFLISL
jgi:hypothetical protein